MYANLSQTVVSEAARLSGSTAMYQHQRPGDPTHSPQSAGLSLHGTGGLSTLHPTNSSRMLSSHFVNVSLWNSTDPGGGVTGSATASTLTPHHHYDLGTVAWENFTWTDTVEVDHFNVTLAEEESPLHLAVSTLVGMFLGTICLMTICGNVLVLLAVFVNSHLRSTTNYFIVNLAIADLLLGLIVLPFSASLEVINFWAFGQTFCDIWAAVDVLCCTASIMSLCVISIDRYIGVTRPLQHSSIMTEKRALYIIIVVWVLATAISVAPLLGWKEPPPEDPTVCEVTKQIGYVLFSVAGSFYIPLVIILVVYFRVYREALSQSRFLATGIKTSRSAAEHAEVTLRIHTGRPSNHAPKNPNYQSSSSSEHSEGSKKNNSKLTLAGKVAKFKREKKAAKTLGIVVGVFIICWFPFFFILPLESLCTRCNIPGWLFKIIFWLGYCNSMMNPIIYACSSREFKRAFTRILKCQWRRRPRSFLDESSNIKSTSTEMSKISRFASVRRFGSRRSKTRHDPKRGLGSATRSLLFQTTNGRKRYENESPIASLRLLHNQKRQITMDTMVSDEESGVHEESSEDEKSDLSNERDALMERSSRQNYDQDDYGGNRRKRNRRPSKSKWRNIPDIIIDEVASFTSEAMHRNSIDDDIINGGGEIISMNSVQQEVTYHKEDSIMWL